jgi:hypothetical protein
MAILKILFTATIFLSWPLYSAVLKHETSKSKLHDYSYIDFCDTMKAKNSTLITAPSLGEVECLNQKFKIIDFCLQKMPLDKHLTRGYAVEKEKKVYCEVAQSVMVSVSCDARDMYLCFDPKKGCLQLKNIYAYRLEVVHYSMLEKNLNCYFAKPLGDNLDEI